MSVPMNHSRVTFYVYVDKTTDGHVFYVGKGTAPRCMKFDRNKKHTRIAIAHGIHRELVWRTGSEEEALAYEVQLISFYDTFTTDWASGLGCNFTLGGEGTSGHCHTPEAKAKLSANRKTRPAPNKGQRASEASVIKRRGPRPGRQGIAQTEEHKASIADGVRRYWATRRLKQPAFGTFLGPEQPRP